MKGKLRVVRLIIAFCLSGCTIRATEDHVFHPGSPSGADPLPVSEDFFFEGDDGTPINARYWAREGAQATVLFFGGNAFYMAQARDRIQSIREHPVNVFMMDYRGYGRSGGHPAAATLTSDCLLAYDVLRERFGVDPRRILVHGQSMGTVPAVYVASRRSIGALFLENPVSTARAVVRNTIPWPLRPFVRLELSEGLAEAENVTRIKTVTVPTFIVGGAKDDVTPARMARRLHRVSGASFRRVTIIADGGHNGLHWEPAFGDAYRELLDEMLHP